MQCEDGSRKNAKANEHKDSWLQVLLALGAVSILASKIMLRPFAADTEKSREAADGGGQQHKHWQHHRAKKMMHAMVWSKAVDVMLEVAVVFDQHDASNCEEET